MRGYERVTLMMINSASTKMTAPQPATGLDRTVDDGDQCTVRDDDHTLTAELALATAYSSAARPFARRSVAGSAVMRLCSRYRSAPPWTT